MEKKELENWEKTRAKGMKKYILKTSFSGYFLMFFIYVTGNAFVHSDNLERYFRYNLNQWPKLAVTAVIGIIILSIISFVFWKLNENRYNKTKNNHI